MQSIKNSGRVETGNSKVVKFPSGASAAKRKQQAKGTTLCRSGFHKWQIDQRKQFDVSTGKLVTLHLCTRCGKRKTTLD
jgi:hypothetical protein